MMITIEQTAEIIRIKDESNGDLYVFGYDSNITEAEYFAKAEAAKLAKLNPPEPTADPVPTLEEVIAAQDAANALLAAYQAANGG